MGCCVDLLLRKKLMPFSFPSPLRTVPDGGNNDTQNYPCEAHCLISLLSPVLLPVPPFQPPLHSLQHTCDSITKTKNISAWVTGPLWIGCCLSRLLRFLTLPHFQCSLSSGYTKLLVVLRTHLAHLPQGCPISCFLYLG